MLQFCGMVQLLPKVVSTRGEIEPDDNLVGREKSELRTQNMWLETALSFMTQGLSVYDADFRLVLFNNKCGCAW